MLDYIIIGCGISGSYFAYNIRKKYPTSNILILEGSNRIGGRLLSIALEGDVYDLGGMRFSKTSHVLVRSMLDELGISYSPIESTIEGSKSMSKMLNNVKCIGDEGFVTYSWKHNYDPIRMSMKQGYDILMDDITLRLMYYDNMLIPDWNRVPIGFQHVCERLVEGIDVFLNKYVTNINGMHVTTSDGLIFSSRNIIFTGQPDSLSKLTHIDYISSFVPYSALRIYIPYKAECNIGYSTKLPLRKIQNIGNALLIYCDSESSRVLLSLIENHEYNTIKRWILEVTSIKVPLKNIKRLIYKYWYNGIYFYKPYKKPIETNINYINGDISNRPGWIEGSLELVRDNINRY